MALCCMPIPGRAAGQPFFFQKLHHVMLIATTACQDGAQHVHNWHAATLCAQQWSRCLCLPLHNVYRRPLSDIAQRGVCVQVLHLLLRYGARFRSISVWALVGTTVGMSSLYFAYHMLRTAAEPSYGTSSELIDAGEDLSRPSAKTSLAQDLLWACVILLPLVGATNYAWLIALLVPVAGAWQGYHLFIAPLLRMRLQEADAPQQQSERAAKRAERRRVKYK